MIELKNIKKSFNGKEILKGITFNFEPGKINLVIGASGSGKSVLMKCMVGLIIPNSGEILYDNQNFLAMDRSEQRDIRRKIGMLFQGSALFDSLTVQENVEFPLKMFTKMTPAERKDRVNFCLEKVDLVNTNNKYPSEISGGMMKRVGIARAISLNIKYLFCDEPNSGLDPITSRLIDQLILQITEEYNITTILNTHDMKSVVDIGENILFLHQGYKAWQGSRKEIMKTELPELKTYVEASDIK